jgi:hypothetical protein
VPARSNAPELATNRSQAFRAAFDHRVLSSVCFFATDIHSATLGTGDDSLARVRKGDLAGKGELVVSPHSSFAVRETHTQPQMIFGKQASGWAAGA